MPFVVESISTILSVNVLILMLIYYPFFTVICQSSVGLKTSWYMIISKSERLNVNAENVKELQIFRVGRI